MARVTVEDCVTKIPNRFELVMLAAQRARDISAGARATVDDDNDKDPVIALREIADETISPEELADSLVRGLQRYAEIDDEPDDDPLQLPAAESETAANDDDAGDGAPLAAVGNAEAGADDDAGAAEAGAADERAAGGPGEDSGAAGAEERAETAADETPAGAEDAGAPGAPPAAADAQAEAAAETGGAGRYSRPPSA